MLKTASFFVIVTAASASAGIIDFETTPGGATPIDDLALDRTSAFVSNGVDVFFGFDTTNDGLADTNAVFEERGRQDGDFDGFFSRLGNDSRDSEAPGSEGQLGQFFLRTPSSISNNDFPSTLVITYGTAVAQLSGEIWDIDARGNGDFEQWQVRGFDGSGNEVAQQLSPVGINQSAPGTLDSAAWTFSLASAVGIERVTIEYVGNADNVGLAFDNYNAVQVPTPGAAALAVSGLLIAGRRRRG